MSVFAGVDALSDAADAPLVSLQDFAEWHSLTLPNPLPSPLTGDSARMQTAIEVASAQIRENRRIFSPITDEVVLIDSTGGRSLLLPKNRLPVTAVSLVEVLIGASYVTVDSTVYDWSADGILSRCDAMGWPARARGVRVTYSHGYAVLPRDVAGICLSLAGRIYTNPDNSAIQSEQLGDHHVTYSASCGLLPDEEKALDKAYGGIA